MENTTVFWASVATIWLSVATLLALLIGKAAKLNDKKHQELKKNELREKRRKDKHNG